MLVRSRLNNADLFDTRSRYTNAFAQEASQADEEKVKLDLAGSSATTKSKLVDR